jgi:hypothetical protein
MLQLVNILSWIMGMVCLLSKYKRLTKLIMLQGPPQELLQGPLQELDKQELFL